MRKVHAEHNETLCDYLDTVGGYNDWVVTTAFYSALHYVEHKMFPCRIRGLKYKGIDEYCLRYSQGKHAARHYLVKLRMVRISPQYRWLYDACMNARYVNYKVSENTAKHARKMLSQIKTHCS